MTKRYRGYAQVCPLAKAAELLCERWTLLVVRELLMGARRFSDVRRGIPAISPTMLSQRLRELEDGGVIDRQRLRAARGGKEKQLGRSARRDGSQDLGSAVEYELTASGRELAPILMQLSGWGHRWAVADLRREDMEPSYLMWVAHKTLRAEKLPAARAVIAYELTDAPAGRQRWWLVIQDNEVELCFKHPGFPVDLTVTTKLHPTALLILGKLSPREAVRTGAVKLAGSPKLSRSFPAWYPRSFEAQA